MLIGGTLVYTIFVKKFREKVGLAKWSIIIMLGVAYFVNFSRGITRHSLAENALNIVLWTAYIYLAVFVACIWNEKAFLPIVTVLILVNQSFVTNENYREISLADTAGIKITNILDTWYNDRFSYEDTESGSRIMTYWEQLAEDSKNGKDIERIQVDQYVKKEMQPFQEVTDLLLEHDETFVDFMNRTFVYSYVGKPNPVYVSQSPLQLSGEYTQACFIEEIEQKKDEIPIVFMPYDASGDIITYSLDGIKNSYRYYKVAEYIYQNYIPLCHNNSIAIWCLPERYESYKTKIEVGAVDNIKNLLDFQITPQVNNMSVERIENSIVLTSTGIDSMIVNLQQYLSLEDYINNRVKISILYTSDVDGIMKLYYTETNEENFSEEKMVSNNLSTAGGTVDFVIPVSEFTRIRLDIPEESEVIITSLKTSSSLEIINYKEDSVINNVNSMNELHSYELNRLPEVWAELDTKDVSDNAVAAEIVKNEEVYHIENVSQIDKYSGNYLMMSMNYSGKDEMGYTKEDDEYTNMTVRMGKLENGVFVEKYRYTMSVQEGTHNYVIRVSSDYLWYLDEIDTIMLQNDEVIDNISMNILQGD